MNSKDRHAREALILNLIAGYPSLAGRASTALIDAFILATEDEPIEALKAACTDFGTGQVPGHDFNYPLNAPQLAVRARFWSDLHRRLKPKDAHQRPLIMAYAVGQTPPEGYEPLGPIKMEIEGIMRDTSDWTPAEKDEAMKFGRMPASRTIGANPKRIGITPAVRKM